MASDVDADCRGKNNNIGSMRHGLSNGTTNLPITDSEVLIESEFLELKSQLHYSKTVHILLTDEFVFVKEMRDRRDSEAHVLQYESGKIVTKFRRSDVSVKLCEGCPFTFKARWSKETSLWKTYELCGKDEVWPKWLRSFNVEEPLGQRMIPSKSICELECGSDSDDGSDDDDGEDVQIPEYSFPLDVDRTISMWSMASMSMLNPSNVRRLSRLSRLSTLVSNSSSDDTQDVLNAGSLYRSNSHPRVSLVKPFRCCSLPHVGDLENVRLDSDLTKHACRTKGETSADESNHALNSAALLEREVGTPNKNTTLETLQQRVEKLRAHPSNLNFVRWGNGDNPPWDSLATPRHRRKHSLDVALTNEANRIPMPSDSGIRLGAHTPHFSHKQEQAHENKMTSTLKPTHETNTPETSLTPKKTNKLLSKRCESMPTSQRPDLSHVTHPVSERGSKEGVARQLDFKDDMAMELNNSNQAPRKDKMKRFWTIVYKKLPKLRMSTLESNESVKETDNDIRSAEGSSLNVLDLDYPNGVNFAGNRRCGLSDITLATKDKISGILPSEETHKKMQSAVQSKQEFSGGDTTPIGKPSFSYSGSMRKKKLVKKILSPIFKSSSQEEDISSQATSPTSDVPHSPDVVDSGVPDLSQRLIDIDASLFAREITLIDKELFIRIPWPELANCGWMTKDKYVTSPNVMAMVEFFNRVALLAATEILSQDTPSGRARAISKVIQIADKCHLLGNFNSLKALLAGLQSTPVYRLKETWKEVPSKRKKKFRDLSILMGESDNFLLYRSELSACLESGPCLPFLGNFLTEIAQTHTYLACKRKKLIKGIKQSPLMGRNDKLDRPDGAIINGGAPKRNGITENGVTPDSQTSPRDKENVTQEKSEKRTAKVKRTPSRSKLWRFHNRQSINDSGVMLNRSRNSSTEVLDIPDGDLRKGLTSSSDSVITSSSSLNESPRNATNGNSRTPSRPPLLRRLSETSSNQNGISMKPKRRLSETKTGESRRSFLKGLVRRTPSSQSVKEGRVSRGSSSEKLTVSLSTLSVTENLNNLRFKDLAKSQSSPSVKEGGRLSPELSPGPLDRSPDIQVKLSSSSNSFVEGTPNPSSHALPSGTERQLWAYQIASIQYDFVSRPFVRHFLLNASFNSEEDNYRLSLKREIPVKKTAS